jgi:hypothetical protein
MLAADDARVHELSRKLARRAQRCPGLCPVATEDEFLALARWQAGTAAPAAVAAALEQLWRFPAEASTWVNRLLLQHRPSPALGPVGNAAPGDPSWKAELRSALEDADRRRAA